MTTKRKGIYILPRIDKQTGALFMEGQNFKLHWAWVPDKEKGHDRFLFSAAYELLWPEAGEQFKKDLTRVFRYMAESNRAGELGLGTFMPILKLYIKDTK